MVASRPDLCAWWLLGEKWHCARHIAFLVDHLIDVATAENGRLVVVMPPRHGKSWMCSRFFPAWYLGMWPDRRVILVSHGAEFAARWGRAVRSTLDDLKPIFGVETARRSFAAHRWEIEGHRGGMTTAGIGGGITGLGAELLIIDDPVRDDLAAFSARQRARAWDWLQSVALTRLEPGGSALLIQTRWHEDDLAGRVIRNMKWPVLHLPAVCDTKDDPLGRKMGEPLWPEQWSAESLEQMRKARGSYWWSALYQGRPAPITGGVFKQDFFRFWRRGPGGEVMLNDKVVKSMGVVSTVDLALSVGSDADWTVIATWGVTNDRNLILLDIARVRCEGPDQPQLIASVYEAHKPMFMAVEATAYQLSLVQTLRRNGIPVRAVRPDRDKMARAIHAAVVAESGRLWVPQDGIGQDFIEELMLFPAGPHDDQVDALAMAVSLMDTMPKKPLRAVVPRQRMQRRSIIVK